MQRPEIVLQKVSLELASIIPLIEADNPLPIDQKLGYICYLLDKLDPTNEANRLLFADVHKQIEGLRRKAVTALVSPIWPDEKSAWVAALDATSTSVHIRCENIGDAIKRSETSNNANRQARRKVREAGNWHDKLGVVQGLLSSKKDFTPADINVGDSTKMALEAVQDVQWWDSDWQKVVVGSSKNLSGTLLPPTVAYGVIHHSITVITHGKINHRAEQDLLARGITLNTVYQYYTVINNCRLLGIQNELLPGAAMFATQVAGALLQTAQRENPALTEYVIAKTNRMVRGQHTYFPLLPRTCTIGVKAWDLVSKSK